MRGCRTISRAACAVLLLIAAVHAGAQAVLVRTATLNALGDAVAHYAHGADMSLDRAVPVPISLFGAEAQGPWLAHPTRIAAFGAGAVASDGWTAADSTVLRLIEGAPFAAPRENTRLSEPGWRDVPAAVLTEPVSGRVGLVLMGTREGSHGDSNRLLYLPLAESGAYLDTHSWPLPGRPIAVAVIARLGRVAVLCDNPAGGTLVHVRDVLSGQNVVSARVLESATGALLGHAPIALAVSPDGLRLYALTQGLDSAAAAPQLSLHALDAADGRPLGDALVLSGTAMQGSPCLHVTDFGVWVVSRVLQTEDAYVRRCAWADGTWSIAMEHSLTGASTPPVLAVAPSGPGVAVAAGQRLERMPKGTPEALVETFDDPIGAVVWSPEGLLVGEGPRLHRLDPASAKRLATVLFQSGRVSDIAAFPHDWLPKGDVDGDGISNPDEGLIGTNPAAFDTDGDSLGDGADPDPRRPNPVLTLPPYILLHGEAAGSENRGLFIDPPRHNDTPWRIRYDREDAPWLLVSPLTGTTPGLALMGINRAAYDSRGAVLSAPIDVSLETSDGNAIILDSAEVQIRVAPSSASIRDVLWLDQDAGPETFRGRDSTWPFAGTAALLAAPPHHFSHRVDEREAGPGRFNETDIVVITAAYAADGLVTGQALMDFVSQGGSLLFLTGGSTADDVEPAGRWLDRAGLALRPADTVRGPIGPAAVVPPAARPVYPASRWGVFELYDAWAVGITSPPVWWVPTSLSSRDVAAAAGVSFGRGRIAVVPSEMLQRQTTDNDGRTAFVTALFHWLAEARRDLFDLDGDGVPDAAEDANRNGVVDPGEMDPLHADSDRDGVPDGEEDRNHNGRQDPDETSAVNVDTDGDGIYDGADSNPLPPREAPVIEQIRPGEGDGQGGTSVMVKGRNFAPNCEVWFGERLSTGVRYLGPDTLIATTPEAVHPEGGLTHITLVNPSVGLRGTLPDAFRYRPVSTVQVSLEVTESDTGGAVAIHIAAPDNVEVGRIALRIDAVPSVTWGRAAAGAMASFDERSVVTGPAPDGGLWVNISDGTRHHGVGLLATIAFTTGAEADGPRPQFAIGWSQVTAPNGNALRTEVANGP